MRYTSFPLAVLMLFTVACSNEEHDASFVSEAQAATAAQPQSDYGWRTTPQYPADQAEVREYR